jgi:hypothetical protein
MLRPLVGEVAVTPLGDLRVAVAEQTLRRDQVRAECATPTRATLVHLVHRHGRMRSHHGRRRAHLPAQPSGSSSVSALLGPFASLCDDSRRGFDSRRLHFHVQWRQVPRLETRGTLPPSRSPGPPSVGIECPRPEPQRRHRCRASPPGPARPRARPGRASSVARRLRRPRRSGAPSQAKASSPLPPVVVRLARGAFREFMPGELCHDAQAHFECPPRCPRKL